MNNDPDARVGANVVNVRLSGECQVAGVGHQQGRGVVVDAAADTVKAPKSVAGCVLEQLHSKGVRAGRRRRLHLVHRGRDGQVVVGTVSWVRNVPGLRRWLLGRVCLVIVKRSDSVGLIRQRARGNVGTDPERRLGVACVRGDQNVSTLANSKGDNLGGIRVNLNEVVGNDCHVVAIDREALDTFGATVDEAKTMSLAGGELELADSGVVGTLGRVSLSDLRAVEVHLSVDQVVVREHRR